VDQVTSLGHFADENFFFDERKRKLTRLEFFNALNHQAYHAGHHSDDDHHGGQSLVNNWRHHWYARRGVLQCALKLMF
jgi:hypothetical protein